MKLVCFDKDNCGYSTLNILDNLEYNIDVNSFIQLCPECKQSLAALVDDFYVMESSNPSQVNRNKVYELVKELERNIKL
jgi:hypothetical protein